MEMLCFSLHSTFSSFNMKWYHIQESSKLLESTQQHQEEVSLNTLEETAHMAQAKSLKPTHHHSKATFASI